MCDEINTNVTIDNEVEANANDNNAKSEVKAEPKAKVVLLNITPEDLASMIKAKKSISRVPEELDYRRYLSTLVAFNLLTEYDDEFAPWHRDLDDIPVLECFRDLVYPKKVSVAGKEKDLDVLQRPEYKLENLDILSYREYKEMTDMIATTLTKREPKVVPLSNLKVNTLISEVKNPASGDVCISLGNMPLPLTVQLYKKSALVVSVEESAKEALYTAMSNYKMQ